MNYSHTKPTITHASTYTQSTLKSLTTSSPFIRSNTSFPFPRCRSSDCNYSLEFMGYFCNFAVENGAVSIPQNLFRKERQMNLFDTISEDIKKAMLARDKVRLEALRGIKKEFLEAKTAPGSSGDLADSDAIKILTRMVKQRKESARIYEEQNRPELAQGELAEVAVIEQYLPKQLGDAELTAALEQIIAQVGAASPADMGKVMGVATKALAGKADGRAISTKVKELLTKK